MLTACGLAPQVVPSHYEETLLFPMPPEEMVMFFAMGKAMDVAARMAEDPVSEDPGLLIIGADTTVSCEGLIMGKPKDKEDGLAMLMPLSGRTHTVTTGVCLLDVDTHRTLCFYEDTHVTFKEYGEEEISAYLDTDEAYDKAGGYAIQGTFAKYIESVDGDVDNVIGFPLTRFLKELEKFIK